jgi:hypothetical protein
VDERKKFELSVMQPLKYVGRNQLRFTKVSLPCLTGCDIVCDSALIFMYEHVLSILFEPLPLGIGALAAWRGD